MFLSSCSSGAAEHGADGAEVREAGGPGGSADGAGEPEAGGAETGEAPPGESSAHGAQTVGGTTLNCNPAVGPTLN